MDTKSSDIMEAVNSSIVDSSESNKSMSDLIGRYSDVGFDQLKNSNEPESLVCLTPSVRNCGNASALCSTTVMSNDTVVSKDFSVMDKQFSAKSIPERSDEILKLEPVHWAAISSKVFKVKESAALESSQSSTSAVASNTGMGKFIKDEKESALIMEPPCTDFDLSPNIQTLDNCYDATDRKQQFGYMEDSSALLPSAAPQQSMVDSSSNFLLDLNHTSALVSIPQMRADSRGLPPVPSKGTLNFDVVNAQSTHLLMCKNEVPRWAISTSSSDSQIWCHATGVTEDQHPQSGYPPPDSIHNHGFIQRSPTRYSSFAGVPPQRLCVICGDEASGCHYGVLTCGSCKVFFKRAVEGHHNYLCAGRNDCIVDKIRRKNCPACRLRKCYQAGMMLGGRKLKRFGALKAMGLAPSLMFQSPLALSSDGQTLTSLPCVTSLRELQPSPQIINILESIEPEVVYSGYDNSQPDLPHLLLNSLNRLCERQLLWIVRWSKSLPGFRNLHISDQMTLIQYSWMNLMVFSLGWRTFQNVTTDYLYFAPDLVLSQERMRRSPIYDLCLAMQLIPQEFANLQVTKEEFLCMKAIMLLNTVPLEGLKSQSQFDEMRQNYIRELTKAIQLKEKGMVASSQRFYHLTKLMDSMHEIVKKVNLYCLSTYIQADAMKVEFPEMMSEVIASQLPKVLAGMVKPLLFHSK
ncbi:progesterone receptor [Chanos chanos]|uniref:Progesterone receptor n=1 Tax=Chanos chanos TaxID=29144 RepID=A0A6J2UP68_CHACN|nr:progesterone receptor [Chanos chanos]